MTLTAKEKARRAAIRKVLRDVVRLLNKGDRELWNIITALRGPDDGNDSLKELTTCQIRKLIGMEDGTCGTLKVPTREVLVSQWDGSTWEKAQGHFRQHYGYALESLEKLGYKFEVEGPK